MVQATNSRSLPQRDHPGIEPQLVWQGLRPAVRMRLSMATDHLLKTGRLNRSDIECFGEVSTPQASADIAEIKKRLPNLMRYDESRKCYILASAVRQDEERLRDTACPLGKPLPDTNISSPLEGEVA